MFIKFTSAHHLVKRFNIQSVLFKLSLLIALVFVSSACKREGRIPGAAPPPEALAPDASVRTNSSARANQELWKRALEAPADSLELSRLAEGEGASGLLEGLEEGGAVGLVALAALPYADDAELAGNRLGEILRQVEEPSMAVVIDSLEGIAQRPLKPTEPLDPLSLHAAFDALVEVAKRTNLSNATRARAVSVARLYASRRPYDARLLPRDFDKP